MDKRPVAYEKVFFWICLIIVCTGILLRLTVFLQNRDLTLDEVNLLRNIHERSYSQLLRPLSYNQFAPVPFLAINKFALVSFGAYEWAVRIYSLLCGALSLAGFWLLLRKLNIQRAGIYPLFLLATGIIYLRYGTEFKQYASDALVTILLLLAALNINVQTTKPSRFIVIWCLIGALAVWISMPSVFVLAGIGAGFLLQRKFRKSLIALGCISFFWLLSFTLYYFLLLRPGIQSSYLQSWHKDYFLFLLPGSYHEWAMNAYVLLVYFGALGGHWVLSFISNILLIIGGIYVLFRKKDLPLLVMLVLPVLLLFIASGIHQFTLLPRVVLFSYPLLLLLAGIGLEACFSNRRVRPLGIVLSICCLTTMNNFNELSSFFRPLNTEWTTASFKWISGHHKPGAPVFIHELAWEQSRYYTSIHPDSSKYASFKNAQIFHSNTDMDTLCANLKGNAFFMFSWVDEAEMQKDQSAFNKYGHISDTFEKPDCRVYLLMRK